MNNLDATRRSVAKYCANILHGTHTRKEPTTTQIGRTLACVPFLSVEDQINLALSIREVLALSLGRNDTLHSITISPIIDNNLRITGKIIRC